MSTHDKELLIKVKEFAKQHKLFINDAIEYSVNLIDIEKSKNKEYKTGIERGE